MPRSDFMAQSLFLSLDVCPGLGISPLRTNIWLSFCGLQSESRLPRRLCHAMPNHRPGEVNRKQQLPFCCRSPCESRDCCVAVAVPSGSELPSSLMLIQYFEVHNTSPNKSTAVIVNDHNADGTTCTERPRHSPMTGLCDDLEILTTARVRLLVDSFVE